MICSDCASWPPDAAGCPAPPKRGSTATNDRETRRASPTAATRLTARRFLTQGESTAQPELKLRAFAVSHRAQSKVCPLSPRRFENPSGFFRQSSRPVQSGGRCFLVNPLSDGGSACIYGFFRQRTGMMPITVCRLRRGPPARAIYAGCQSPKPGRAADDGGASCPVPPGAP